MYQAFPALGTLQWNRLRKFWCVCNVPDGFLVGTLSISLWCNCSVPTGHTTPCPQCKRVAFLATLASRFVFGQVPEITCSFRRHYLYIAGLPGPFSDLPDLPYQHIYLLIVRFSTQHTLHPSPGLVFAIANLPASPSHSPRILLLLETSAHLLCIPPRVLCPSGTFLHLWSHFPILPMLCPFSILFLNHYPSFSIQPFLMTATPPNIFASIGRFYQKFTLFLPFSIFSLTLGVIPGRYIVSLLRDFKQFTHTLPSR